MNEPQKCAKDGCERPVLLSRGGKGGKVDFQRCELHQNQCCTKDCTSQAIWSDANFSVINSHHAGYNLYCVRCNKWPEQKRRYAKEEAELRAELLLENPSLQRIWDAEEKSVRDAEEKTHQNAPTKGKGGTATGFGCFLAVLAVALFIGGCYCISDKRSVWVDDDLDSPGRMCKEKNPNQNVPLGLGLCAVAVFVGWFALPRVLKEWNEAAISDRDYRDPGNDWQDPGDGG